jgi:hypothetical protein
MDTIHTTIRRIRAAIPVAVATAAVAAQVPPMGIRDRLPVEAEAEAVF